MRNESAVADSLFLRPPFQLALLVFTAITLFFAKLAGSGLMSYDDGYYANKAREMMEHGTWLTVYFAGKPSFDNPPFFFWLERIGYNIFGIGEYGACLPSAILGVLTMVLVYVGARRALGLRVAFFSSLILITTPHFLKFSRHAMVDVTLTFFVTLSLLAFYFAPQRHRALYLVWGLGIAAAMMTKSLLGTFAIWVALSYLVLSWQWRELLSPYFWLGLIGGVGLGSTWYIHQYMTFGDVFLHGHFYDLLFSKATLPDSEYDLIYHLKYVLFPFQYIPHWVAFMVIGFVITVQRAWHREKFALLNLLWLVVIMTMLSIPLYKKTWYLMPAVPALALMGGIGVDFLVQRFARNTEQMFRKIVMVIAFLSLGFNLVALATPISLSKDREVDMREFSPYVRILGENGFKLTGLQIDYYSVNNASLFYSDYAFAPVFMDVQKFQEDFLQEGARAALIPKGLLPQITISYKILKEGDDFYLIANRDADFSKIRFLKSRVMK